jgi:hypothetical protein
LAGPRVNLVPGIHDLIAIERKDVDGRDKPGHDESEKPVARSVAALPSLAASVEALAVLVHANAVDDGLGELPIAFGA